MIGNIMLSILEADALDRAGLSIYATRSKDEVTYTFYRVCDQIVYCNKLTEEQTLGILAVLIYTIE